MTKDVELVSLDEDSTTKAFQLLDELGMNSSGPTKTQKELFLPSQVLMNHQMAKVGGRRFD